MQTSIQNLNAFDILNRANSELSALASNAGIDWQALSGLINRNQTTYSKAIELDKAHKGKVKAWVSFKTAKNGQDYPIVTFHTLKHGGVKETFNGYSWLKDNGYLSTHSEQPARPSVTPPKAEPAKLKPVKTCLSCGNPFTPAKAWFTECSNCYSYEFKLKRFQETKALFDSLPPDQETSRLVPQWVSSVLGLSLVLVKSYLGKKGFLIADIQATGLDIRRGQDSRGGFIIYALRNIEGKITGYQKIYDEKFIGYDGELRDKDFCFYPVKDIETGEIKTLKQGSFAVLGSLDNADRLFFCEGLATGLSVFLATGLTVIVCLDAYNLAPVLSKFSHVSKKYIAADNDTKAGDTGNVGIYSALNAARFNKARVFVPILQDSEGNFLKCDFDDLRQAKGLDAVKQQLKLRNNDNETKPTPEKLFKHCPKEQLKDLALSHCYQAAAGVYSRATLKEKANEVQRLFDDRRFTDFKARRKILGILRNGVIKTVTENNCFTGHPLVKRIDIKGLDNQAIAAKIQGLKGILIDNATLGNGKTNRMAELKNRLNLAHWQQIKQGNTGGNFCAIAIAHRVSLIDSLANRLGVNHYDRVKSYDTPNTAICLPSIPKFSGLKPDFLAIDETRQTLEFLHDSGGLIENPLAVESQLIEWINTAGLTIVADADFNQESLDWLLLNFPSMPIYWLDNGKPQRSGKTIQVIKGGDALEKLINRALDAINADKSAWLAFDSETQARRAYAEILQTGIDSELVLLITGDNKAEPRQAAFLANPDSESRKYQVIIHSPVISSGVSILTEFDFVGAGFVGVIPPNEMLQMIARLRKAKNIFVAIKPNNNEVRPTDINDLITGSKIQQYRINSNGNYELSSFDSFRLKLMATRNAALNNFEQQFLILAQLKGYRVKEAEQTDLERLAHEKGEPVKTEISTKDVKALVCEEVLIQNDLSEEEAARYEQKTALTQSESYQLVKYHTRKMTGKQAEPSAADLEYLKDFQEKHPHAVANPLTLTKTDIHFFKYDNGLDKVLNFELLQDADIEKAKADDKETHETRRKLPSKTGKLLFFQDIIWLLKDKPIKRALIKYCLDFLHENHQEVAINGLGNFKQKTSDTRKLNAFLEKCGYEIVETGKETTGNRERIYTLQINEQIKTYADNRKRIKQELLEAELA